VTTAYVIAQLISVAAVVLVAVVAVRRYKTKTDAAFRAALAGMDVTFAAARGELDRLKPFAPPNGSGAERNGHHAADSPGLAAAGG